MSNDTLERFEREARQVLLNQVLYDLVKKQGGEVTFPLSIVSMEDMGGFVIEVDPNAETVTIKNVNPEEAKAYAESLGEQIQ